MSLQKIGGMPAESQRDLAFYYVVEWLQIAKHLGN